MKLWDTPFKMLMRVSVILLIAMAAVPSLRHAALVYFLPKTGFTERSDMGVQHQSGQIALDLSTLVNKHLPAAIDQVEKVQGYSLERPPNIYVFDNEADYSRLGGCPKGSRACVFGSQLSLSPKLLSEPDTVLAILTHELSHVLLQQRLGTWGISRVPPWFLEGLAVMVSDGGGAEGVGSQDAAAAIKSGQRFTPDMSKNWLSQKTASHYHLPHRMFYRQSALFVLHLKTAYANDFESLLRRMHSGMGFHEAFERSFSQSIDVLWEEFLKSPGVRE
jgi:Zn-dependent protease with chaperone function